MWISCEMWGVNKKEGADTEIDARVEIDEDAYEAALKLLEELSTSEEQRFLKQTTPLFQWY